MVLECAGHGLVVDCGVMFPEERLLGNGVYVPDFSELSEKRVPIDAVVLTHAHEDHIGALPYLLRKFPVPVYGTAITLAFVRRRLEEAGHARRRKGFACDRAAARVSRSGRFRSSHCE